MSHRRSLESGAYERRLQHERLQKDVEALRKIPKLDQFFVSSHRIRKKINRVYQKAWIINRFRRGFTINFVCTARADIDR